MANSRLHAADDAYRPGIRIGAATGDSPELFLSRNLKTAQIKRYPNPSAEEALRILSSGEIDAWATNRQRLIEMAASAPDTVNRVLAGARKSGLIQAAIDRAGLKGAVDVAPEERRP